MADKVAVEEINGTLALQRMKHREKLLKIIRGSSWDQFLSTLLLELARTLPITLIGCYLYYTEQKIGYLLLILLFIFTQAWPVKDRRFDALVELLDLDSQPFPKKQNEKSETTHHEHHP